MKTEVSGTRRNAAKRTPMPTSAYEPTEMEKLGKKIFSNVPIDAPSMAPIKRVGANIPPGVPLEKEMVVATILSRARARRNFQVNWPCMAWSITLYPGPITWGAPKKAIAPTMSPAMGGWIYQVQRGSWRNRGREYPSALEKMSAATPPATPRTA